MENRLKIYRDTLSIFITNEKKISDELLLNYFKGFDDMTNEGFVELQNFIELKPEIEFTTYVAVLDAVELLIHDAIENGNIDGNTYQKKNL